LKKLKLRSIKKRKSKVDVSLFGTPQRKGTSFRTFYKSLPDIWISRDIKKLVDAIIKAKKKDKMVIFMLGAHVIKCGLSRFIIELMKENVVKTVALNGAGIIHDTEIAMAGKTSEEVDTAIKDGSFGMTKESASFINNVINKAMYKGYGIGMALGAEIAASKFPHRNLSILYWGNKLGVPVTVHVGIGTDTIHQHPSCNGAAVGEGSFIDFRNFIYSVSRLNGGVIVNFGSAVLLPEVFLKALSTARNLGYNVKNFTAANFDMHKLYRPQQNVVRRPVLSGGQGFNFIGHHEIMIPLLYQAIKEKL
jgi:glutaredoxin-related protein